MPNRLANANSPYLLQHANNPVDWFPWGDEALQKARTENKPIFLSIGYAACHWCHVMEHESFENPATAALMNQHFVSIKVDREERPDLDSIYMSATTALTGSGGWPMSVFLTPDLKPFYAGTYFPPVPRYNMPSFNDLLSSIARAWREDRENVLESSVKINEHLQNQASWSQGKVPVSNDLLNNAVKYLHENYDYGFGGWGQAPKFPQPMTIEFLLRRPANQQGTKAALHALQAMARGGMYDVVGGGFSRYSTDNLWRVPHFEKMLYDNAQLVPAYLHAWQITGQTFYRRIVEETLAFVTRELTAPEGGFYSSLDADSEGEEGKFYVWQQDEIKQTLGEDFEFVKAAYGITPAGNWEGNTVLQRALDDPTLAARFKLPVESVAVKLADCHERLLTVRATRIRPNTDDKVLTAWNGLMLSAFAAAARAFQVTDPALAAAYTLVATRNADFLLTALRADGRLRRVWRAGNVSDAVFLDDYAALINGLIDLYQTDFNPRWFAAAQELVDEMIVRFADPAGGFFDTPADGETLLLRPKDLQDNAVPSGSALAVDALLKLAAFGERDDYRVHAEQSFNLIAEHALRYPTAFARWLCAMDFAITPTRQVAIVGDAAAPETQSLLRVVRQNYQPHLVLAASDFPPPPGSPTLLNDRPLLNGKPAAYVCEGFVCKMPVGTAEELKNAL